MTLKKITIEIHIMMIIEIMMVKEETNMKKMIPKFLSVHEAKRNSNECQ